MVCFDSERAKCLACNFIENVWNSAITLFFALGAQTFRVDVSDDPDLLQWLLDSSEYALSFQPEQ